MNVDILFLILVAPGDIIDALAAVDRVRDVEFVYEVRQTDVTDPARPRLMYSLDGTVKYVRDGCVSIASRSALTGNLPTTISICSRGEMRNKTLGTKGRPVAQQRDRLRLEALRDRSDYITSIFVAPYLYFADAETRSRWEVESTSDGTVKLTVPWARKCTITLDLNRGGAPVSLAAPDRSFNEKVVIDRIEKLRGADGAECWMPLHGVGEVQLAGGLTDNGRPQVIQFDYLIIKETVKLNRGLKSSDVEVAFDKSVAVLDIEKRDPPSKEESALRMARKADVKETIRLADKQQADALEQARSAAPSRLWVWQLLLLIAGAAALGAWWATRRGGI